MKFLLLCSFIFTQAIFAFGYVDLKNVNISYVNGAGSIDFEKLNLGMGIFEVNINDFNQVDLDYKNSSYYVSKRFSNTSDVDFIWKLDESTSFIADLNNNVVILSPEPMDIRLGTRKTKINIPSLQLATSEKAFGAKNINMDCNYQRGETNPDNYIVHVIKACLVNSRIIVDSIGSKQEDQSKPLFSREFDAILEMVKHPLSSQGGIDLDKQRKKIIEKEIIHKLDWSVKNSIANIQFQIKAFKIPLKVNFLGKISLLEKSKQIRVNVQEFKILGINLSTTLVKMVEAYLKTYDSKILKVDYPYIYMDVSSLY